MWGGFSGLGFAPWHLTPCLLLSFAWLYGHLCTTPHRFRRGWCFGFGQALACLYWLYEPLTLHWPRFCALIPAAMLLLPGYIALYAGLAAHLQRHFSPWGLGPLLFASQWVILEWVLGHLLTGFPWTLAGYTWNTPLAILQIAAYGGIYGLSFFTVLLSALMGEAFLARRKLPALAAGLLSLVGYAGGEWRLHTVSCLVSAPPPMLRLVQGNIPQEVKWRRDLKEQHLETYLRLSFPDEKTPPQIVLWPEAALPFLFDEQSGLASFLGGFLGPSQILITGAMRKEGKEARNSLIAINASGKVLALYDKHHLLPFGEYVPCAHLLPIQRVAQEFGLADTSPGEPDPLWTLPDLPPLLPSICYEIIFPHDLRFKERRGAWMLNVSNDAWFGHSSEPHHHAHIGRFRAIEAGVPLVHVTNTGKTGIYSAFGEEVAAFPLFTRRVQDHPLPGCTQHPTFFSYLGSFPLIALLGLMSIGLHCLFWKRSKAQKIQP
jgi:apolipoprotein N-acyltransferase